MSNKYNIETIIKEASKITEISNELDYEKCSILKRILLNNLEQNSKCLIEMKRLRKIMLVHQDKVWTTPKHLKDSLIKESDQAEIDAIEWIKSFRLDKPNKFSREDVIDNIKLYTIKLRKESGLSLMDCKRILYDNNFNYRLSLEKSKNFYKDNRSILRKN